MARIRSCSRSSWPLAQRRAMPSASGIWISHSSARPANATRPNVQPGLARLGAHGRVVAVQLEQHRLAVRRVACRRRPRAACRWSRSYRFSGFEQVGHAGVLAAGLERLARRGRQRELPADQPRLVGVEDACRRATTASRARRSRAARASCTILSSRASAAGIAVQDVVGEVRLDGAMGGQRGDLAGVPDGVVLGDPVEDEDAGAGDQHQDGEARRPRTSRPAAAGASVRPSEAAAAADDQAAQQLQRAHPVAVAGQRVAQPGRLVEQPQHGLLAAADVREGAGAGQRHLDQVAELAVEIEPEARPGTPRPSRARRAPRPRAAAAASRAPPGGAWPPRGPSSRASARGRDPSPARRGTGDRHRAPRPAGPSRSAPASSGARRARRAPPAPAPARRAAPRRGSRAARAAARPGRAAHAAWPGGSARAPARPTPPTARPRAPRRAPARGRSPATGAPRGPA